jgi:hypothetical protein
MSISIELAVFGTAILVAIGAWRGLCLLNFPQDSKRFSEIAAGVQACLISLAVVVGGIWTLWTFLIDKRTKDADLQVKMRALDSAPKIELQISKFDVIPVKSKHGHVYVQGEVIAKNFGTGPASLRIGPTPVCVYRVDIDDGGEPTLATVGAFEIPLAKNGRVTGWYVPAGGTKQTPILAYVDAPGLYIARILTLAGRKDRNQAIAAGLITGSEPLFWSATRYFVVTKSQEVVAASSKPAMAYAPVLEAEMSRNAQGNYAKTICDADSIQLLKP